MTIFSESPGDRFLERIMVTIPGFKPRGQGTYIFGRKELTAEMCDCRQCPYYKGKRKGCSLKHCSCVKERITVGAASRKETLEKIASDIKVCAFQKRVYQLISESEMNPMDYRNEKHRIAFTEAIKKLNKKDFRLMSAVYLLSADFALWKTAKHHINKNDIDFDRIKLKNSTEESYTLFCCAKDLYLGTKHITIKDLADKEIVNMRIFNLVCNAMAIRRFGLGAITSMNRGDEAWR